MRISLILICIAFLILLNCKPKSDGSLNSSIGFLEMGWLAGYWTSEEDSLHTEEFWLHESGRTMLGLHREVYKNDKVFFEFLRIVHSDQGISYFASPAGRKPTEFRATQIGLNKITFENPDHDFPRRIIYHLESQEILTVRIEGETAGKTESREWTWKKSILETEK